MDLLTTEKSGLSQVTKAEEYSSLNHLLSVTALVLKFIANLRRSQQAETLVSLMSRAEAIWLQECQATFADDHFQTLKRQLGLFQDSRGIWIEMHR